jgi:ribose-phosphate pyrophosphokinase
MITVNDVLITPTVFPDGTQQVWKLDLDCFKDNEAFIVWEFHSETELITLAQIKTLMDAKGVECVLRIPYLPYARQDKSPSNETTFALHTFAQILNAMEFPAVFCSDIHSDVALRLINNLRNMEPLTEIGRAVLYVKPDLLCYPDKGAQAKYSKILHQEFVCAYKERNQLTGEITGLSLYGDVEKKSVLIVDDICDGGMTFIKLSEALYKNGATDVNLYVTHGLFSKGKQVLFDSGIKRIFTRHGEYL